MPRHLADPDLQSPPFERFRSIQRLGPERSGHASADHARHQLYVGRDTTSQSSVLIKVTSKPGLVYQQSLANEIESLTTINRELPDSRTFPVLWDHGSLADGRLFVIMSFFDESPLATTIGPERQPDRLVIHLRTSIAVGEALAALHRLGIVHVDLNPMNILFRWQRGSPVIRIVDFESSYERARHASGVFYNPPTTSGFSAPEAQNQMPDARSDVYSLSAVLYTLLSGYGWTWESHLWDRIAADTDMDRELRNILQTASRPEPRRRYRTIRAFGAALRAYVEAIWPGRSW